MCFFFLLAVTFEFTNDDYREREGGTGFMPVIISKDSEVFIANPIIFRVIPLTIGEAESQGLIPNVISAIPDHYFSPVRAGWRSNL